MKTVFGVLAVLCVTSVAAHAAARCEEPTAPNVALDPTSVSEKDIFETFRAVKAYQRDVAAYRECLESSTVNSIRRTVLHNQSVKDEQALVQTFNEVLSDFRKRRGEADAR